MPRVHVLHAHPCEESFNRSLCTTTVEALTKSGWEVDLCDLYAEGFNPVLTDKERRAYHDTSVNTAPVQDYVDRLRAADAVVFVFPVWNFGYPAILKGWFDRVMLPGVSFDLTPIPGGGDDVKVTGALQNIRKLAAVTTYGATKWRAFLAGDPPRKLIKRAMWGTTKFASVKYLALNDMNNVTEAQRHAFLAKVKAEMEAF